MDEWATKLVNVNGEKHIEEDDFNNTILIRVTHFTLILGHMLSPSACDICSNSQLSVIWLGRDYVAANKSSVQKSTGTNVVGECNNINVVPM